MRRPDDDRQYERPPEAAAGSAEPWKALMPDALGTSSLALSKPRGRRLGWHRPRWDRAGSPCLPRAHLSGKGLVGARGVRCPPPAPRPPSPGQQLARGMPSEQPRTAEPNSPRSDVRFRCASEVRACPHGCVMARVVRERGQHGPVRHGPCQDRASTGSPSTAGVERLSASPILERCAGRLLQPGSPTAPTACLRPSWPLARQRPQPTCHRLAPRRLAWRIGARRLRRALGSVCGLVPSRRWCRRRCTSSGERRSRLEPKHGCIRGERCRSRPRRGDARRYRDLWVLLRDVPQQAPPAGSRPWKLRGVLAKRQQQRR